MRSTWAVALLLILSACKTPPNRVAEKEALLKQPVETEKPTPVTVAPAKPVPLPYPAGALLPISLNVTEHMPVRPVLSELAKQADVGLSMPVDLPDKRVDMTIRSRPIYEAIEQLCAASGLRATWQGNNLQIEADLPYSHNYAVQFLNLTRTSDHHVATSTDVFANNTKSQQMGDNGSDSTVKNASENDFWHELEKNLILMLDKDGTYTVHKQAGLVTVIAKQSQHRQVETYLNLLRKAVRSQVVIEAKVVEVILKDEFRSGINWKKIKGTDIALNLPFGDKAAGFPGLDPANSTPNMLQFGISGKAFESVVNALDEFGITRTLSSPRLTVMNNQTALLKVAKNQVYFRLRYDKRYSTNNNQESVAVSSDIQTIPIGLVLSVHPSIDLETNEIILFLRPTISRLNSSVRDPAVDIAAVQASQSNTIAPSTVPVVEVREIDSVLRTKSGEIAVLGGLMEVRTTEELSQLPILGDVPGLRELFGAGGDSTYVVELVILLRATISDAAPDAADERLSRQNQDPRAFHE